MIVNAMIPARMGSTRLKQKNLALINNQPMVAYALLAAKNSGAFEKVYLNSENDIFQKIADRYSVDFYKRKEELGSSSTKSDDIVADFMINIPGDVTVWVNSISPLQSSEEIRLVVNYFIENDLDTLMTVRDEQVHCLFGDGPLNFSPHERFAQTQDLLPVRRFVYSIMMWKNKTFLEQYREAEGALFCGRVGYYSVSKESALIVKTEEDIKLIDSIVRGAKARDWSLSYDSILGEHSV